MDDELTWSFQQHDAAVTLGVRGALTRSACALDRMLRKALLDRGRLVVDVTHVRVLWGAALAVFTTALASAGGWPLARLVTNAVQHAGDQLVLHLTYDRRGLTVGVRDGSAWGSTRPEAEPDAERFGLRVVAGLSDRWGVPRHDDGKTVWALLRSGTAGEPRR